MDDHLSPSSLELFDLMHIQTCREAERIWRPDWTRCPVCFEMRDNDGTLAHMRPWDV